MPLILSISYSSLVFIIVIASQNRVYTKTPKHYDPQRAYFKNNIPSFQNNHAYKMGISSNVLFGVNFTFTLSCYKPKKFHTSNISSLDFSSHVNNMTNYFTR